MLFKSDFRRIENLLVTFTLTPPQSSFKSDFRRIERLLTGLRYEEARRFKSDFRRIERSQGHSLLTAIEHCSNQTLEGLKVNFAFLYHLPYCGSNQTLEGLKVESEEAIKWCLDLFKSDFRRIER